MSPGNPDPQVLELPGKPTVWRTTDLPPRHVALPYLGRMPRWRMLTILLLGTPLLPVAVVCYPAILVASMLKFNEAPFKLIETLFVLVIGWPLLMAFAEAILLAFRGVFHHGHHARFDTQKFWHFQLSDPIAFSSIERLEVFYARGDPMVLRLTTGQPIRLRFASLFNRRRPSRRGRAGRFTVSSGMIAGDKMLLIDAIGHLVEANGGIVERKEIWSLWFDVLVPWS